MKPHELRYGNSVMYGGDVAEVIGIAKTYVSIKVGIYTHIVKYELIAPVPITEACLLEHGFENWGINGYGGTRYVLHNVIDGTSNFEIHYTPDDRHKFVPCVDDDCCSWAELEYLHTLENLFYSLTGEGLTKQQS